MLMTTVQSVDFFFLHVLRTTCTFYYYYLHEVVLPVRVLRTTAPFMIHVYLYKTHASQARSAFFCINNSDFFASKAVTGVTLV